MRIVPPLALVCLAGCFSMPTHIEEPTTQVPISPFNEPRPPAPTRVSYAPAPKEVRDRALLIGDQLLAKNPEIGLKAYTIAIGGADPEIFHVGKNIYVSEGLMRQCGPDNVLAAVLANEMGRMVSEREAAVPDDVRQPDRLPPPNIAIGNAADARFSDPFRASELATFEKQYRKQPGKMPPPNPQFVARKILEKAGYQGTDLDAALPALQNADRFRTMENQFKGVQQPSQWKTQ